MKTHVPFCTQWARATTTAPFQRGLELGLVFAFSGGTDHHSAHPGSYGHGLTGDEPKLTRNSIWDALTSRRMFALTGDRMDVRFRLNDAVMGSVARCENKQRIEFDVQAGAAIDAVDVLRTGQLVRRFSQCDMGDYQADDLIRTKLHLEVGWGAAQVA